MNYDEYTQFVNNGNESEDFCLISLEHFHCLDAVCDKERFDRLAAFFFLGLGSGEHDFHAGDALLLDEQVRESCVRKGMDIAVKNDILINDYRENILHSVVQGRIEEDSKKWNIHCFINEVSRNLFDDTIRDDIFLERYQKILDAGLANFDVREKLPEGVVRQVACPLDMDVLVAQMSGEFLAHVRMREFYARKERWLDFSMNDGNDVRLVEMMYALLSGNRQAPLSLVENGKMPFSYDNIMVIDTKGCHEMCLDKIYNLNTLYKIFEFPQEKQHIREMSKLA